MAVDCKDHGTIGCAYYVAKEERLFCMQDVPKGNKEIVDRRMSTRRTARAEQADDHSEARYPTNSASPFDSH
jgi:hypothetical protein